MYLFGYSHGMSAELLEQVRRETGLSQGEFAARAGTSRPTLSAYEHGHKSPTLATVERMLHSVGFELHAEPSIAFREVPLRRGRPIFVAERWWRLPVKSALRSVELPAALHWSRPGTTYRLSDRRERARCYEVVLREGMPPDILSIIDGALLADLWPELVLPRDLRSEWQPLIDQVIG